MNHINFLPPKYALKLKIKFILMSSIFLVIIYGFIILSLITKLSIQVGAYDRRINQLTNDITNIKEESSQLEYQLSKSFLYKKFGGNLDKIPQINMDNTFLHAKFMTFLGTAINPHVYLEEISFSTDEVIIKGQADDYLELLAFTKNVIEKNIVYKLNVTKIEPIVDSNFVLFEISCVMKKNNIDAEN